METMIEIKPNIFFDLKKPFEEQEDEVRQAVRELSQRPPDSITEEPAGHWPRPLSMIWDYTDFVIERKFIYQNPTDDPSNGLCTEKHFVRERT